MNKAPVDVALVRMPYSELGQPSLAVGLLKAVCDRHGLTSRAIPANLWFSEEVGPALHDLIFEAYSTSLIGEWTFSGALFPNFHADDDAYLKKVVATTRMNRRPTWRHIVGRYPYVDLIAVLREIRRGAPAFIDRVADHLLELEPKIVGCSSTFQQHCASLALLRVVKQRRPEIITMIGGANCEGDMGRATFEQFPWLDFAVSGEADGFFGRMCTRLIESGVNGIPPQDLPDGVWGPHHRRDRGAIHDNRRDQIAAPRVARIDLVQRSEQPDGAPFSRLRVVTPDEIGDGAPIARLDDMNESPVPNYDDYFAYLAETEVLGEWVRAALPFQTARGCWWGEKHHCTFCGISRTAMKFRPKSSDNVMEQMFALRDRYGISNFQGTEYIFDYRYFDTLLPRLKGIGGYFRFEVKANLKPQQLQAFLDAGTLEVQPGVESLSDSLLALIDKGVTACQNILLLKRARKIGLLVYWNMLHTIPGDRDEWYGEMAGLLPLVSHLQPPYGCAQVHYDRFSPYWRDPARYGVELQPAFGYEHVYPFAPDVLKEMAYFFETPHQRNAFYRINPAEQDGLWRLIRATFDWKDTWLSKTQPPPTLMAMDMGDKIVFTDTRPVATCPSFEIAGLEERIYRAAEDGVMPVALVKKLRDEDPQGVTEEEIQAAVSSLIAKKVLVHLSGKLLALGVTGPIPLFFVQTINVPRAELDPSWARMMADEALDEKRPNIALSCLYEPDEEPLSTWLAPARRFALTGAR